MGKYCERSRKHEATITFQVILSEIFFSHSMEKDAFGEHKQKTARFPAPFSVVPILK